MTYKRITTITLISLLVTTVIVFIVGVRSTSSAVITGLYAVLIASILWAHLRNWRWSGHAVVLTTSILVIASSNLELTSTLLVILVPVVLAGILLNWRWVLGIFGLIIVGMILKQTINDLPLKLLNDPFVMIILSINILGIALANRVSQHYIEAAEQSAALAQEQQQLTLATNTQLEQQAHELHAKNQEQERLFELVATLEIPALTISEGILFVPLMGHLDTRRAQDLTTRILERVYSQRARAVILDTSGIAVMDSGVVGRLLSLNQAIRLLGCRAMFSGITAAVAQTIAQLGLQVGDIETAQNPQDALNRLAQTPLQNFTKLTQLVNEKR